MAAQSKTHTIYMLTCSRLVSLLLKLRLWWDTFLWCGRLLSCSVQYTACCSLLICMGRTWPTVTYYCLGTIQTPKSERDISWQSTLDTVQTPVLLWLFIQVKLYFISQCCWIKRWITCFLWQSVKKLQVQGSNYHVTLHHYMVRSIFCYLSS